MIGPRVNYSGVKKGLPFQARFEEAKRIGEDAAVEWVTSLAGTVARDSNGRRRLGFSPPGVGLELGGFIDWPDERLLIVFDTVHRTYSRVKSSGGGSQGWYVVGEGQILSFADGETRRIEGLECRKIVVKSPDGNLIEAWVSDRYGVNVLETRVEDGQFVRWRLQAVETKEPASELFQIAAGFAERQN